MNLTTQQKATLKTFILANPAWAALPAGGDSAFTIAAGLNALASPNFFVWRTSVPTEELSNAISWANFTPGTGSGAGAMGSADYTKWCLACQGKQFNVQIILQGRQTISGANANLRAGLQDALQNVPSGASGALQDAGWTAVRNAIARQATVLEKQFADTALGGGSTRALSATMVLDGSISYSEVQDVMGW